MLLEIVGFSFIKSEVLSLLHQFPRNFWDFGGGDLGSRWLHQFHRKFLRSFCRDSSNCQGYLWCLVVVPTIS